MAVVSLVAGLTGVSASAEVAISHIVQILQDQMTEQLKFLQMLGYLGLSRKQDILQFILRLMEELQILLSLLQHRTVLMQVERLAIVYNNFNGDKKNAYTYFSYHLLLLLFYIRKTKIFNQYN